MPPGMFNNFEHNRHADWDTMLEARREFEAGGSGGGADAGQMALVFGAAVLAIILIAMVLTSS